MKVRLKDDSFVPYYYQIADELRDRIESGAWEPQSLFPSETELCGRYNVSRGTVRQALSILVRDGLLYRQKGKGTYVAEKKSEQQLIRFHSFARGFTGEGIRPFSRVSFFDRVTPPLHIAGILRLGEGDRAWKIVATKHVNGPHRMHETLFLSAEIVRDLDRHEREEMERVPLYDLLIRNHGISITGLEESFEPLYIGELEAKDIGATPGSVGMVVKRTTYTTGHIPFEYRQTLLGGEHSVYTVKLTIGSRDIDLIL